MYILHYIMASNQASSASLTLHVARAILDSRMVN
jgi:hypothetical protein